MGKKSKKQYLYWLRDPETAQMRGPFIVYPTGVGSLGSEILKTRVKVVGTVQPTKEQLSDQSLWYIEDTVTHKVVAQNIRGEVQVASLARQLYTSGSYISLAWYRQMWPSNV